MGSVQGIVCPKCGANIELKDGQRISFCSYCGSAIEYDDGVQRTEHKSDIKFSIPTIEKLVENQKEIKLEKMRIEEEDRKRKEKMLPYVFGVLLLIIFFSVFSHRCSSDQESASNVEVDYGIELTC